jgi:hypothetical protein
MCPATKLHLLEAVDLGDGLVGQDELGRPCAMTWASLALVVNLPPVLTASVVVTMPPAS